MLQNPNPIIHEKLEKTKIYDQYLTKRKENSQNEVEEFDALEGI